MSYTRKVNALSRVPPTEHRRSDVGGCAIKNAYGCMESEMRMDIWNEGSPPSAPACARRPERESHTRVPVYNPATQHSTRNSYAVLRIRKRKPETETAEHQHFSRILGGV